MEETILTTEDVENLTDLVEGFRLMEKCHVPTSGCKKVVDIKERLKLHLKQQSGESQTIESIAEAVQETLTKHNKKCERLQDLLTTISLEFRCLDEQVIKHLRNEGTLQETPHCDLLSKIDDASQKECHILITGDKEVEVGNMVNVLLGQDILPGSLSKLGSVICAIRYGAQFGTEIKDSKTEVVKQTWCSDANYRREVSEFISMSCEKDDLKLIDIFAPLPLLKAGLSIIYCPHPEDLACEKAENVLRNTHVPIERDIFAVIYACNYVDVDVFQTGSWQNILNTIGKDNGMFSLTHCDVSSLILVHTNSEGIEEAIDEQSCKTLTGHGYNLQSNQVLTLSVPKAMRALQLGYITEDLSRLFEEITQRLPQAMHKKTEQIYWWTETLLSRCLHHVTSFLARTRFSADDLLARQAVANERLFKIESESELIMERLEIMLNEYIRTITGELLSYLKSENARCKIGAWQLQQLPFARAADTWKSIETKIDCIIETRLLNIMCDWDTEKQFILAARRDLFRQFKREFLVLENQLETIDHILERHTWSFSDATVDDMKEFSSWVDTNEQGYKFQFKVSAFQKLATAIRSLVGMPVPFKLDFERWRKISDENKQLKSYIEDPVSFVHRRSLCVLDKVTDFNVVYEYVATQMEPVRDHLNMMRASIPKLIQSNRDLIKSIAKDKRTREELESNYLGLEKETPNLQECLASFGNTHVRKYDHTRNSLELIPPETSFLGRTIRVVGLWSEISKALFTENSADVKKPVSLKIYIKKVGCLHLQREEANLRRCRHPQIVSFIAAFEAEKGIPGFILEPHLVKARRQLFGFKALPKTSEGRSCHMERCRQVLEQVGMGLEYMHYKCLVHLELSLDSIMMLANKDEVKLINIGEPRVADLPDTTNTKTEDHVYLPPEVLNGDTYKSYSDIYSLGLVTWELWHQEKIYQTERKESLNSFIEKLNTGRIQPSSDPSNALHDLMQGCFCEEDTRISSTVWVNEIRKLSFKIDQEEKMIDK